MSVYLPAPIRTTNNQIKLIFRVLFALAGGIGLFVIALLTILLVFQFAYLNRIYPGVSIAGINLSGSSPSQPAILISNQLPFVPSDLIFFQAVTPFSNPTPYHLG